MYIKTVCCIKLNYIRSSKHYNKPVINVALNGYNQITLLLIIDYYVHVTKFNIRK